MSKWCADCSYGRADDSIRKVHTWYCLRPVGDGISPVTGEIQRLGQRCEGERVDPTGCGPEGRYFEERT